mmetsp:Transcript_75979/g.146822  ORF Transcript_75979/g.146822 Transcript_75979/m.146822 type:complete len:251 (+) Transcript_75979:42-794(+)
MPQPLLRGRRRGAGKDDFNGYATSSAVGDGLSRISENSKEGGSIASSGFLSAVSGTQSSSAVASRDSHPLAIPKGGLLGAVVSQDEALGRRKTPAVSTTGHSNSDTDLPRAVVKAFVEQGVRGLQGEALRPGGQPQPIVFRLSRHVDSFEVEQDGKLSQAIYLTEVVSIHSRIDSSPGDAIPGLDENCAIIELEDGRCLALRFPPVVGNEAASAATFIRCMRVFVHEVRREHGERSKMRTRTEMEVAVQA